MSTVICYRRGLPVLLAWGLIGCASRQAINEPASLKVLSDSSEQKPYESQILTATEIVAVPTVKNAHEHGPKEVPYVCPMHPDVRSDKPGKCPKCGMNLIKDKKHENH